MDVERLTHISDSMALNCLLPTISHLHHRGEHRGDYLLPAALLNRVEVARTDREVTTRADDACARDEASARGGREQVELELDGEDLRARLRQGQRRVAAGRVHYRRHEPAVQVAVLLRESLVEVNPDLDLARRDAQEPRAERLHRP